MTPSPDLSKPGEASSRKASRTKASMALHRRSSIADFVRSHGVARVGELAERFDVSEVTIRNDLDALEKEGRLIRDHGGAIASTAKTITSLDSMDQRSTVQLDEKRRIGQAAAARISPGDTIILDAGTTVIEVARALGDTSPLTVVTNALNVALELGRTSTAKVILLGGTLSREASSTIGQQTEQQLGDFVVQKLFVGTQAMDLEHGLTDTTLEIAQVKRAMIRAAREVILLTDSTKWAHAGFIKVAPLSEIDVIITDSNLSAEARAAIERLGIELVLV